MTTSIASGITPNATTRSAAAFPDSSCSGTMSSNENILFNSATKAFWSVGAFTKHCYSQTSQNKAITI